MKTEIIESKSYELVTFEINKISLLGFNDKRYELHDKVKTLAYGHKDTK